MEEKDLVALNDWNVLSISDAGEAVIGHKGEGCDDFVATKVRTFSVNIDENRIYSAYKSELEKEARVREREGATEISGSLWHTHFIMVEGQPIQYVLYASTVMESLICVVEALFLDIGGYNWFKQQFSEFVQAVDFKRLHRETGSILIDGQEVIVTGISGITLKRNNVGCSFFVGKDKYFAVTADSGYGDVNELQYSNIEFIESAMGEKQRTTRYALRNDTGKITGTFEVCTVAVGNSSFQILGYWVGDVKDCIVNNLDWRW